MTGQRLVLDLDGARGAFGQLFGLRGDGSDGFAHAPDFVGQHIMVLVQRLWDGDDALVVEHVRDVVEGEHTAPIAIGCAHVNALDASVRVRAGDDAPVQHPSADDVAGILFLPGDPGDSILATRDLAKTWKSCRTFTSTERTRV